MPSIKKSEACTECGNAATRVRHGKRFKVCEECRRAVTSRKWKVRRAVRQLRDEVTHVVEFNEGTGWRTGYLLEIMSVNARVQPIGSCGRIPETITVCLADVKIPSCGSPSMPTVDDFYRKMEAMKPNKVVVLVAQPPVLKSRMPDAARALAPVSTDETDTEDLLRKDALVVIETKDELAGPEVGDTSFPFGANAAQETNQEQSKANKPQSKRAAAPKPDAIVAGSVYGVWTTIEYTGHSRWRCKNADGAEKVVYAAELRAGTGVKPPKNDPQ